MMNLQNYEHDAKLNCLNSLKAAIVPFSKQNLQKSPCRSNHYVFSSRRSRGVGGELQSRELKQAQNGKTEKIWTWGH